MASYSASEANIIAFFEATRALPRHPSQQQQQQQQQHQQHQQQQQQQQQDARGISSSHEKSITRTTDSYCPPWRSPEETAAAEVLTNTTSELPQY